MDAHSGSAIPMTLPVGPRTSGESRSRPTHQKGHHPSRRTPPVTVSGPKLRPSPNGAGDLARTRTQPAARSSRIDTGQDHALAKVAYHQGFYVWHTP